MHVPSSTLSAPAARRLPARAIWALATGAILSALLAVLMIAPLKDDIAWLLYVADNWLDGSRLYIDLVEVNPPLVIWLYAIPAGLARVSGVNVATTTMPVLMAFVLGCAAWTAAILADGRRRQDPLILFCVIALVLCLVPGGEFGQREHLLIAAALPWLATLARAIDGAPASRRTVIGAAVLGAIGCALKPQYLLAFAALEPLAMLHGLRPWRAGVLAAIATALAYTALVLLLEPAFVRDAVPLAFTIYGYTDVSLSSMLADCVLPLLTIGFGTLVLLRRRLPQGMALPAILLLFTAGTTFACILQSKVWFYHRIPAMVSAVLFLLAWLHEAAPSLRTHLRTGLGARTGLLAAALPAGLAALLLGSFSVTTTQRLAVKLDRAIYSADSDSARLEALIRKYHARSYLAFSDWIALGFPVVNDTHVRWASRFDSTWALSGEVWESTQPGAPRIAAHPIATRMSTDFRQSCPDLVVVDRRSSIDYVEALAHADPAFLALWRSYDRVAAFDGLVIFKRRTSTDAVTGCRPTPRPKSG